MTIRVAGTIFKDTIRPGEPGKPINETIRGVLGVDNNNVAGAYFLDGPEATVILTNHARGMSVETEGPSRDTIQMTLDGALYNLSNELIEPRKTLEAIVPGKGQIEASWNEPGLPPQARR